MTGALENGLGEESFRARAGALTLLYIASPMERSVLLALLAEATTGVEVLDDFEPPGADDPIDLSIIADPYLVEPADPEADPDNPIDWDTSLRASPAGQELLFVAFTLERWLNSCPAGSLQLGPEAGPALSALLCGWSSAVVHALAGRPLTIAEVTSTVGTLSPDGIEDRIEEMVSAGLLDVIVEEEERFAVTDWLRAAIAPLGAAARLEHRYPPGDTAPIAALDVEAAFQLTLPLLELPTELSGSCSLAVDLETGVSTGPAGVIAKAEDGRITSCDLNLAEVQADAWATASVGEWLDSVIEPEAKPVRTGGDRQLVRALLRGLHQRLFGLTVA